MVSPSFFVGVAGNVISILVFTSPVTTFWRIVKKKSTLNYEGIPYVTTLLSTSFWTYYGLLKSDLLVVTVNGAGCVMQATYVVLFLAFAPKSTKIKIVRLAGLLNVLLYGLVVLVTMLAFHGRLRVTVVGCTCAALSVGMYAAPMAAARLVVQTKSVEFMPFSLSFFLFLNGGVWSAYAFLIKDFYIGIPNGIGLVLGTAQLVLYAIYCRYKPRPRKEAVDLEAKGAGQVVMGQVEMVGEPNKGLRKVGSLPPLKRTVSRQNSLTKIVKSLSLPPIENSNWNLDELLSNSEEA